MSDEAPDDELLDALGARVREREAAWTAVARGERDAEEVAAERARAGDSEADIALARALYRPLDPLPDDERERTTPASSAAPQPASANTSRYLWWSIAAAVVAAVVLALVLFPRDQGARGELVAEALPPYTFDPGAQRAFVRGDPPPGEAGEALRYHLDNTIEWTLRPELEVREPLATHLYLLDTGSLRALELGDALALRPNGAATLDLRARQLGLEPGEWILVWVIGRAELLTDTPALTELEREAGVHVERLRVQLDAE